MVVNWYFDKRVGVATGLATCGASAAAIAFPPFIGAILDHYGYTGTWMIISAVAANMICVGALYRQPNYMIQEKLAMEQEKLKTIEMKALTCTDEEENEDEMTDTGVALNSDFSSNGNHVTVPLQRKTVSFNDQNHYKSISDIKTSRICNCFKMPCKSKTKSKSKLFDFTLLRNLSFLLFCTAVAVNKVALGCISFFLPAYAHAQGIEKTSANLLLSFIGISDWVSRMSSGILFDTKICRRIRPLLFVLSTIVAGISVVCVSLCADYVSLTLISVSIGLFTGVVESQRTVILGDLFGVETLSSSVGMLLSIVGVFALVGPTLAGKFSYTGGAIYWV